MIVTEYIPADKMNQFHEILCATGVGVTCAIPCHCGVKLRCTMNQEITMRIVKHGTGVIHQLLKSDAIGGGIKFCGALPLINRLQETK